MKKRIILLSSLFVLCSCNNVNNNNNVIDNLNNKVYVNTELRAIIGFENDLIYYRDSNYNYTYTYNNEYTKNNITYYVYKRNTTTIYNVDNYLYFSEENVINFYCRWKVDTYELKFTLDNENIYTLNDCKKVL